ncbi:MAG TPA: Gfo/Idh/MocA family oxidoreductase [Spirochaetia bacterium]|nr:Gfo/Idh/MocA family oxidoreductase [Spirochaetia bacterium]
MAEQAGQTCQELHLGFIGAGDWVEKYHIPVIRRLSRRQRLSVSGIWNRTRSKAENLVARFDLPKVYRDLQEIIDDPDVDRFAVAVNSRGVRDILRRLAVRNLPVLCEKPPGRNGEEARELAEVITATNVVAFNRRYMPLNQQFKSLLEEWPGIDYVECSFYRRDRDVASFVTETGIHGINLLEYLIGDIAGLGCERWAVANTSTCNWLANLRFSNGVRGLIKFFPFAGINLEMVAVSGRGLTASIQTAHPFTDARAGFIKIDRNDSKGEIATLIIEQQELDPLTAGGFEGEYLDFFGAIRENRTTVSNFQNAWRSMVIAEAIERGNSIEL